MEVYCSSFSFTLCVKQFQCKTILRNTSLTFSRFLSKNVLWWRPEVWPLQSPHPRLLSLCREATASNCSSNTHWNPRPPPHPFKDSWKTLATCGDTKQYSKARTFLKMTQYQQAPRSRHLSKADFLYGLQVFKQYPTKKGGNPLHTWNFFKSTIFRILIESFWLISKSRFVVFFVAQ